MKYNNSGARDTYDNFDLEKLSRFTHSREPQLHEYDYVKKESTQNLARRAA